MAQKNLFGIDNQLKRLSDLGDQLETLDTVVDFEVFRPDLIMALHRSDGSKGGRPPYDVVTMFKILVIQAMNDLSDERLEFLINDRLSFMRFLGFEPGQRMPHARTIWLYRDLLTRADAIDTLFQKCDAMITEKGYLAMGGQIADATIVPAPKQRLKDEEKAQIKEGKSADEIWGNSHKARHKDTDARWSIKYSRAKTAADGSKKAGHVDIAIPAFGFKNHIATDRRFGFIRGFEVTGASAYDGRYLRDVLSKDNTASDVWADSAYRSKKNETWLVNNGFKSRIHQKKPKGRPMPQRTRIANAKRSSVRSKVEHVFGDQKTRMGLFVRTIGIARAKVKIGMINIAYNMRRLIYHERLNAA